MFDDRIEVYSPGTLPPGVSLEKMRRLEPQSVLRNPIVVGVFRDLGGRYIEQLGTGVRLFPARGTGRIARAMEAHGLPRPRFDVVGSEFRVTLTGPGERFMEERKELPSWARGLNERQVEAVLYLGEHEWLTNREYQASFAVSYDTAYRDLRDLLEKGLIKRLGKGRATYYTLAI
jgi:ATP-dependent DNA helicase RecG